MAVASRNRSKLSNPWVFVPLVVAAVWVNLPLLAGIVSPPDPAVEELFEDEEFDAMMAAESAPYDPAAATFAPFLEEAPLVDPFYYPSPEDGQPEIAAAPTADIPTVRMVLCSATSKRALVDDALVGIGDAVSVGIVQDIHPDGVVIRLRRGGELDLELQSIDEAEALQDPGDGEDETHDDVPTGGDER